MPLLSDKVLINAPLDSGIAAAEDAANYLFATRTIGLCLIANDDDDVVYYRVHDDPENNEASATVHDGIVPANDTVDISYEGVRAIKGVSIFFPTSSAATVRVMGLVSG